MWIFQRLMVVLAIGVVLLFVGLNAGESVRIQYWFGSYNAFDSSPLPVVIVTFFLLGVLFYYLFSIAREWRLRAEIRRLKKSGVARDRELSQLRNIALDDEDLDSGPAEAIVEQERDREVTGP